MTALGWSQGLGSKYGFTLVKDDWEAGDIVTTGQHMGIYLGQLPDGAPDIVNVSTRLGGILDHSSRPDFWQHASAYRYTGP